MSKQQRQLDTARRSIWTKKCVEIEVILTVAAMMILYKHLL